MALLKAARRGAASLAPTPFLHARARPTAAGWPMPSHMALLKTVWRGAATFAPVSYTHLTLPTILLV
eukprot:479709-Pyramimonas_sp.AAC.1